LLDDLDESPIDLQVTGFDVSTTYPVIINGDRFFLLVYGLSMNMYTANYLPKLIDQVKNRKMDLLPSYARYSWGFTGNTTPGAQVSAACAVFDGQMLARSIEGSTIVVQPRVARWLEAEKQKLVAVCTQWGMMSEKLPSQSWSTQAPVLMLTSAEHTESLKAYNKMALENFRRSYEVQLSIPGDFLVLSDCGGNVAKAFIIQPAQKPDDSCNSRITMIPFELP